MTQTQIDEIIQWVGAVAIILGHICNAVGPRAYPLNVFAFAVGTAMFLWWSLRVRNRPQLTVNVIVSVIGLAGIWRAIH